jgi:hypothetical protein
VCSSGDPAEQLLQSLQKHLPATGAVVVWNKTFETGRNNELASLVPAYAPFLESLNGRLFDLMEIFRDQLYVHPGFRSSCSIKDVLPVLVSSLSYGNLRIQDGATASATWYRMVTGDVSPEDPALWRDQMLRYCELDTFAMVEIFRHLEAITNG